MTTEEIRENNNQENNEGEVLNSQYVGRTPADKEPELDISGSDNIQGLNDDEIVEKVCKKTLEYMNEEDYCNLTKEEFVEEQLKEDLKDLIQKALALKEEEKRFEHKDWNENCKGGLLPATNIRDCYVCLNCGYDSRGMNYSRKNLEQNFTSKLQEIKDELFQNMNTQGMISRNKVEKIITKILEGKK